MYHKTFEYYMSHDYNYDFLQSSVVPYSRLVFNRHSSVSRYGVCPFDRNLMD